MFGVVVDGTTSVEVVGGHPPLMLSMLSLWHVNHVCGVVCSRFTHCPHHKGFCVGAKKEEYYTTTSNREGGT